MSAAPAGSPRGADDQAAAPPPFVLISYAHAVVDEVREVTALASRLRDDGIDARLDQYEPHPEIGWPVWMEEQIRRSARVLLFCTPAWRRRFDGEVDPRGGHGVRWEGLLIRNTVYSEGSASRFTPLLRPGDGFADVVPLFLRGQPSYTLDEGGEGYRRLLADLRGLLPTVPSLGPGAARSGLDAAERERTLARQDEARWWNRAAPLLGSGLLLSALAPALPALTTSGTGKISLVAVPLYWLASGLVLLSGVARAAYDEKAHPWHLGRLGDTWKWVRSSLVGCFTAGRSRQLAVRVAVLAACFLGVWFGAHPDICDLDASQQLPVIVQAMLAILSGAASWGLAARRSRTAWVFAGGIAAAAWWCLRNVEPTVHALIDRPPALQLAHMLLAGPLEIDARERWLPAAPACGPFSMLVSSGLALLFVRVVPRRAVASQRALLAWAAAATVAAAIAAAWHGRH